MPRKKILKNSITFIDSTLRDGSHAVRHQLTKKQISQYAQKAEEAGVPILVVGHGNGLGASSIHLGFSKFSDIQMLMAAKKKLKITKLGAFVIPGFGTIKSDIQPAIKAGVSVLMVATHCTEADIAQEHIEFGVKHGIETYGVLMMSHMIDEKKLLMQAKHMQESGAKGVILMDSAGAYTPDEVEKKVGYLSNNLSVSIGFHAHNNLGLAVANSLAAIRVGAEIIDGTARGIGAGAGNCPLEIMAIVLKKLGYKIDVNPYTLMDAADFVAKKIMLKPQEIDSLILMSGFVGVFSGFIPHIKRVSTFYHVDPRDILIELGRLGVVAGQEDIIIHVAERLSKEKNASS